MSKTKTMRSGIITVCAVAKANDVPSQWESQKIGPLCSHIFQLIFLKLKTKKDIPDTTLRAKFG